MGDIGCKAKLGQDPLVSLRSLYTLRLADQCSGEIYFAHDILLGQDVAIKLELVDEEYSTLEHEFDVYRKLSGGTGILRVHWFGRKAGFNAMVIDRLGHSLDDLFVRCHHQFSVKTVLFLARQLVSLVHDAIKSWPTSSMSRSAACNSFIHATSSIAISNQATSSWESATMPIWYMSLTSVYQSNSETPIRICTIRIKRCSASPAPPCSRPFTVTWVSS